MQPVSLEDQYRKILADHITLALEDLTDNEHQLINKAFAMFKDKLDDIKTLNDEIYRINLELANTNAMADTDIKTKTKTNCPICGHDYTE